MQQQRAAGFVLHRSAAERQHDLLFVAHLPDRLPLLLAKICFAKLAEDLRYSALAGGFDDLVQIDEPPAQVSGQNRSDGGLAGTHEASQDQPGKPPLCPGWLNSISCGIISNAISQITSDLDRDTKLRKQEQRPG